MNNPNHHRIREDRSLTLARCFQKGPHRFLIAAFLILPLLLCGSAARAQVNQLHFLVGDAPGTTTMVSDTNLNTAAINATLTMFNPAGTTQVDLHGAVGSGVNGALTG